MPSGNVRSRFSLLGKTFLYGYGASLFSAQLLLGNRLRGTVVFCFTRLFGLFLGFRYLYVFRIIRFDSSFGTVRLSSPPFPSSLSFPFFMYELD